MKLHSFKYQIFIFSIISLFFVLPSLMTGLTNTSQNNFTEWNFPLAYLILFFISSFVYITTTDSFSKPDKNYIFYKFLFPATYIFCLLFCNSLIFKAFSTFFSKNYFFSNTVPTKPAAFKEILFCILNFIFSATYEEIIYRFYLPEALNLLFSQNKKTIKIIFDRYGVK